MYFIVHVCTIMDSDFPCDLVLLHFLTGHIQYIVLHKPFLWSSYTVSQNLWITHTSPHVNMQVNMKIQSMVVTAKMPHEFINFFRVKNLYDQLLCLLIDVGVVLH